jgi:hypothetical protein
MSRLVARFAFLALGLIAASALLFQPICEAAEQHLPQAQSASHATAAYGGDGEPCCSIVAPAALRMATAPAQGSSIPLSGPTVRSPVSWPPILIAGAMAASASPFVSSYYARSARIQR